MRNQRGAFTLVELLIVVAIIGILAAVAIPHLVELLSREQERSELIATPRCPPTPEPPKYSSLLWLERECDEGLGAIYITSAQVSMAGFTEGNNTAHYPITIFNGADTAGFSLTFSSNPEKLACTGCLGEYVLAPEEVESWVDITAKHPIIHSGTSRDVDIIVTVPKDACFPFKWAFWIMVKHEPTGTMFPSLWLIEGGAE